MSERQGESTARHYQAAHDRIAALVTGLTDEQLATAVPSTPGWTVHGVLSHLVAVPTDGLAGRIGGIPSDQFTAGQVAERRDRSVGELLDEWRPSVEPMCEGARAGMVPPHLAVDALTHEQDIRGALGLPSALSKDELRFCINLYASGCSHAIKKAELAALSITTSDSDFTLVADDGEPQATVRAPEFELFRAFSGRRSRAQVAAFDWAGDSSPYLDVFCVFGPLPLHDVHDT